MRPNTVLVLAILVLQQSVFGGDETYTEIRTDAKKAREEFKFVHIGSYASRHCYIDPAFNANQRKLIERAFKKYAFRVSEKHIRDAAWEASKSDLVAKHGLYDGRSDRQTFRDDVWHSDSSTLYISRITGDKKVAGRGWLGIVKDGRAMEKNFFIGLNADYMHAGYYYGNNYHYWSGVIGHQVLHNLGYSHANGYSGSLVKEFGEAIQADRTGEFSDDGTVPGFPPSTILTPMRMPPEM